MSHSFSQSKSGVSAVDLHAQRAGGGGPWAAEALAEDARRLAHFRSDNVGVPWAEVKAWMQSWGAERELPAPKPRKL
jgi:hypothetical protein